MQHDDFVSLYEMDYAILFLSDLLM